MRSSAFFFLFTGFSFVSHSAIAEPVAAESSSLYVQAGQFAGTRSLTVGATLPWRGWRYVLGRGEVTGYWDGYVSQWSYDGQPWRSHIQLIGITPTLRWAPGGAASPWFVEGGVGATLADHLLRRADKQFSTTFNFASHIGVGMRWGERKRHEFLLRVQHVSNGRIKHPNPGQNFLQLRYAIHL